jgi:FkbM family methyltransferase
LRDRFVASVEVVEAAVGAAPGTADLLVPAAHTLATLSPEWAEAVCEGGRFAEHRWDRVERVDVGTLDDLISRYGRPTFVKIDVEGYELEALRGLSAPVDVLSLEFDFEFLESRLACVDRLASLGMPRFNFSEGETMALVFAEWVDAETISSYLRDTPREVEFFGDVYASA